MIEKFKRQMLKCLFLIIIILMLRWNSTGGKSLRVNLFQFYKNFFNNLQKLSDIFINNLNHQMNIFSIHKIEYPWSSLLLHLGSYIHSTSYLTQYFWRISEHFVMTDIKISTIMF